VEIQVLSTGHSEYAHCHDLFSRPAQVSLSGCSNHDHCYELSRGSMCDRWMNGLCFRQADVISTSFLVFSSTKHCTFCNIYKLFICCGMGRRGQEWVGMGRARAGTGTGR